MGVIRFVFLSALVLAVTACASDENVLLDFINKTCSAENTKDQPPANWNQAKTINLDISGNGYGRDGIYMKVGEPTVLQIANTDKAERFFIDGDFFDSVAMAQVTVGSAKTDRPCISGVHIGPGKKAELRFVPMKAGIFYPEGNALWFLGVHQGSPGFIYVKG
ncbi:MAG: hypothetical protein HN377_02890 [Alphaproteobacteria bacterium]|jgi:hypothetical protein|nr:hypothetical protein [Alphaproteobacteria bacterium]MBT7942729.1 hypothetical protein [Alphaproteobacteria bacterium]